MQISRDRFVGQFWPCVQVQALSLWSRRSKTPPDHVGRAMYDAMQTSAGDIPISSREFSSIVEPVIHELHRTIPKTNKPDAQDHCGRVYDVLSATGIEVKIRPPVEAHGGAYGRSRSKG